MGAGDRQRYRGQPRQGTGVENERCLFITNYLNGSDFGGPTGRLTSKWRVWRAVTVDRITAKGRPVRGGIAARAGLTTTAGPGP